MCILFSNILFILCVDWPKILFIKGIKKVIKNISCAMIQNSYPPKHFMLLPSVFRNYIKKYSNSGKESIMWQNEYFLIFLCPAGNFNILSITSSFLIWEKKKIIASFWNYECFWLFRRSTLTRKINSIKITFLQTRNSRMELLWPIFVKLQLSFQLFKSTFSYLYNLMQY